MNIPWNVLIPRRDQKRKGTMEPVRRYDQPSCYLEPEHLFELELEN